MWYLLLGIVIVALGLRLILIQKELRNIRVQLQVLNTETTRKKLTTQIANKEIDLLCSEMNRTIEKQEKEQVRIRNHEEQLKASITNISHDLRTPLTSILGYISMMKERPEKSKDYLEIIEGRSQNLYHLIQEFYELSMVDDRDYEVKLENIDVVEILISVLAEHYENFETRGIEPHFVIPEKKILVYANQDALGRVFQNLIYNAIKYTQSKVEILLDEYETELHIKFRNQAEYLELEVLEHLFDRFYTVDKSRTNGGTGLGLYIVKTLCEKMGIQITCKQEPNHELEFTLILIKK